MYTNPFDRRRFLQMGFGTLGGLALTNMSRAESTKTPHHKPKAKAVILCYMSGGFSHVDSFDPKPMLDKMHGKKMPVAVRRTQFDNNGNIFKSPWKSKKYGKSGIEMTNLFPHIGSCADDIAVVRSMTAKFSEHAQGNLFMHSGFPFLGHPSAGAWVNYGLGSVNENLPGYVVLKKKTAMPHGGVPVYGNGYLPATNQASFFDLASKNPVPDIAPRRPVDQQRQNLDFLAQLDSGFAGRMAKAGEIKSAVKNYETAFKMQSSVPELADISKEPEHIKKAYGLDSKNTVMANYGHQALMARRLVERGVRFVELTCASVGMGAGGAANPWDQHGDLERGHGAMAKQVDQPIAALIKDLKQRGLLDETLIIFTGEFGRTPFSQGSNGRDHNPYGFSLWMAGGGIKGGTTYGATDELGYYATEKVSGVYDLWATVLHLLGMDHEKLTYRFGGRDMRLTDVHGEVWHDILT
jgi:hypothetical protein